MKQTIRIIGGQFRGKKIHFPAIPGLRPTSDRVRETLFNWLMHDIHDARCLDVFAGSGALGLEAFSRGAKEVVFLEQSLTAYTQLKKTCDEFKSFKLTVLKKDASLYLKEQSISNNSSFDIIFFDPPFKEPHLLDNLAYFIHSNVLVSGGLLYLETPTEITLDSQFWQPIKIKQTGQVTYALYQKRP